MLPSVVEAAWDIAVVTVSAHPTSRTSQPISFICLGLCSCNKRRFSSNGQDAEGNSGDCSYLSPYARSDDKFAKFSSS